MTDICIFIIMMFVLSISYDITAIKHSVQHMEAKVCQPKSPTHA